MASPEREKIARRYSTRGEARSAARDSFPRPRGALRDTIGGIGPAIRRVTRKQTNDSICFREGER